MTDKQALRKLIEAVEAGTLPDEDWRFMHDIWSPRNWHDIGHNVRYSMHGSIDAAKALHEALLPGWRLSGMGESDCTASGWFAHVTKRRSTAKSISAFDQPRPSRAWLLAILRAYEAQR